MVIVLELDPSTPMFGEEPSISKVFVVGRVEVASGLRDQEVTFQLVPVYRSNNEMDVGKNVHVHDLNTHVQ